MVEVVQLVYIVMTWKIFNRLFKEEEFNYCFVREAQPSVDFAFAILILH